MRTIGDYWKGFAARWEESSYEGRARGLSLVERIATRQREHIVARRGAAVEYLRNAVGGRRIVDVGCGGGALAIELARLGAAHVTGIDISPEVVAIAARKAAEAGVGDRVRFAAGTIEELGAESLGAVDLLTGLGILEYLRPEDVVALIARLRPRDVFFSYDERRLSMKASLHFVYRTIKQLPYYKKYAPAEITGALASAGVRDVRTFRVGDNSFATSLGR